MTNLYEQKLLISAERKCLLSDWNINRREYPDGKCIHQLFAVQAEMAPDAVALLFRDEELSYGELNQRANRLAHCLQVNGIGPDMLVGICIDRSIEMVVGLIGILKAGGAYLPLDQELPQDRLAFMLEDAEISLILTNRKYAGLLPFQGRQLVFMEDFPESFGDFPDTDPETETCPDSLAYVMYTSGSTGLPKGVEIPHRGVVRLVVGSDYARFGDSQTFLQLAPFSFDASTFEIWGALLHGSRCVLYPDRIATPQQLGEIIRSNGITTLWLTSSFFNAVVDFSPAVLQGVSQLLTGGEALSPGHVQKALKSLPGTRIINGYGPTESTTFTCCYPILADAAGITTSVPIGRPIANTWVYVLDEKLQPVPTGVEGELYIGGDGLARGYLNRSELTREKFIPDPFSDISGSRLYKTGDLVRYRMDGNLEFIGRIDHQVKIRGFRVELGEIEVTLRQHPAVQDTVVVVREDVPGSKRLVAYVVTAAESPPMPGELRRFLSTKLPEYMVPSIFVRLEFLPLTVNRKVDRSALPAPEHTRPEMEEQYLAPRTPVEQALAQIWEELLELDLVGVHDNFFELGGDSLQAMQMISQVRSVLNVELPIGCMFATPTVSDLADNVQTSLLTRQQLEIPVILPAMRSRELPLSFAQQRLLFLDRWEPGNISYNESLYFELTGSCDTEALKKSLNEIVRRHEALRTTFVEVSGEPVQRIASAFNMELVSVELPARGFDEELRRLAVEAARRPFHLEQGPLVRATLFRQGMKEHVLLVVMHHIVTDGWSMGVFCRELAILYGAFSAMEPSPLPELSIQYGDFAVWQREYLQGDLLESQLSYWKKQLDGVGVFELPADRLRPPVQTFNGSKQGFIVTPGLCETVRALSRRENVTLFMTLLAAFQTLLYRYNGQDDIAVGSPIANRSRVEIEPLIGFFVNTLVLRTSLAGNPTFRELLSRVRGMALDAYAHQDLPFEKLVGELNPPRDPSRTPLFQVMFVLLNTPVGMPDFPGMHLHLDAVDTGTAKFDLSFYLTEEAGRIQGNVEYNTDIFDRETIERMIGHYLNIVETVSVDLDQRIDYIPLLSAAERQQLLIEWNATKTSLPQETLIHQLFERQVALTPDGIAVVFDGEELSYAALNARANQLACVLIALGVVPDAPVAIALERKPWVIVALLATLKAGGAYVPLDPDYPAERLNFMLEDSGAKILLTQETLRLKLPFIVEHTLYLDTDRASIDSQLDSNPNRPVSPEHLAYIIYTSGSTGKPKGVAIEHRSPAAFLDWACSVWSHDELAGVLAGTSICFDLSIYEIFLPIAVGGSVILASNVLELPAIKARDRVTLVNTVPSAIDALLCQSALPASVLTVNLAGEPLTTELADRIYATQTVQKVYDLYGPSEDTTYSTFKLRRIGEKPSVGRPIANTQIYVFDHRLQPVPIGVPGELHLGGAGLARGYLNRPELTAEKFIHDPFSDVPGSRLYKTGDLVRYRRDGNLEFLGRIDHQVKIRGFRIELGEIEVTLRQHPDVRETAVVVREDVPGNKRLVAYIIPIQRNSNLLVALRAYLQEKLPSHMIPAAMVLLEALPLTANGKLDRRALPPPDYTSSISIDNILPSESAGNEAHSFTELEDLLCSYPAVQECCVVMRDVGHGEVSPVAFIELKPQHTVRASELVSFIAQNLSSQFITDKFVGLNKMPHTAGNLIDRAKVSKIPLPDDSFNDRWDVAEFMLAKIWQELLGITKVDRRDNFFDLGGDSLQAVHMVTRLETELGVRLPIASLFKNATIEALARTLRDLADSRNDSPLTLIQSGTSKLPLFFFHGDFTGGGFHCLNLARYIGVDQTFYAVHPYGLPGLPIPSSVEEMAEEYLEHIIAVDPEGPYLLAGYCNGALVAYEVAQRLLRNGKRIELLLMIEPPSPGISQPSGKMLDNMLPFPGNIDFNSMNCDVRRNILQELYVKICVDYFPQYCQEKLTFILAGSTAESSQDKTLGWGGLAGEIDVHIISCGHLAIMTHQLEKTGKLMRACIDKVNG